MQSQPLPRDADTFLPLPWPVPLPGMFFPATQMQLGVRALHGVTSSGCFRLEARSGPDALLRTAASSFVAPVVSLPLLSRLPGAVAACGRAGGVSAGSPPGGDAASPWRSASSSAGGKAQAPLPSLPLRVA